MDSPKVSACCADMVVIVRDAAFLLAVIITFVAKKYIISHPAMFFEITGSMWNRVVEVGIAYRLPNSSNP